jgi:hypothetical protein
MEARMVKCHVVFGGDVDAVADYVFLQVPRIGEAIFVPQDMFRVEDVIHFAEDGEAEPTIQIRVTLKAPDDDRT